MLDDSDKISQQGLPLLVSDHSSRDVAEDVRAACLNSVQVTAEIMVNKHVNLHYIAARVYNEERVSNVP